MKHKKSVAFGIAVLFVSAVLLSICIGAVRLRLPELWAALKNGPNDMTGFIFWYSRLPRTAACLLAGAALAVSGAVIQSVLHNKLASPGIIGVNAGAGFAVTVCCACGVISGWTIAGSAFLGAMGAMLLVVFIGQRTGASRTTVILAGVAVNAILNAFTEAVTTVIPEAAMMSVDFRVGGFGAVSYGRLIPAAVLILLPLSVLFCLANDLDVLTLGDDTAKSLGMNVKRMRTAFLMLAALLAGAAVSFAGLLGFVGLIVPHALRKFVGSDSRWVLPMCALAGAGFVALCDTVARFLFAPYELSVGILMSVLGGPAFLMLLLKQKGGRSHA